MTTYILNLFDLAFTLHAINHGGVELNPILQSVPFMVAYKTILIPALIWWLARSSLPIAQRGLKLCTAVFAVVNLYHIYFIFGGIFL